MFYVNKTYRFHMLFIKHIESTFFTLILYVLFMKTYRMYMFYKDVYLISCGNSISSSFFRFVNSITSGIIKRPNPNFFEQLNQDKSFVLNGKVCIQSHFILLIYLKNDVEAIPLMDSVLFNIFKVVTEIVRTVF